MSRSSDLEYLRTVQYRDASNLEARLALHERFSVNPVPWPRWVFERLLAGPKNARVLEVGCGPATLWRTNRDQVPTGWRVVLTDLSAGMVTQARQVAAELAGPFACGVADAQHLPWPGQAFNLVIANHMLYHLPDRDRALAEIRRVLRPGGWFFTATNGEEHLRELDELLARFLPGCARAAAASGTGHSFSLENGEEQLRRHFGRVRLERYEDALSVTEVEPLLRYIGSMIAAESGLARPAAVAALKDWMAREIASEGTIRIRKATGLFVAG